MIKIKTILGICSALIGVIGLFVPTTAVDTALLSAVILIGVGIATICARKNARWLCLVFALSSAFGAYSSIDVLPAIYAVFAYIIVATHIIIFYFEISSPKETPQQTKTEEKEDHYENN